MVGAGHRRGGDRGKRLNTLRDEIADFRIVSAEVHDEFGKPEQGEVWELVLDR